METQQTTVIINGAGPTGLSLACQLLRYGIDFIILDKNEKTTHLSKAMVVHARTMEIFHEIGVAEKAVAQGQTTGQMNLMTNGKIRQQLQLTRFGEGLTQFPFFLILEQSKTETLLAEHLVSEGKQVQWNSEFIRLEESGDHVTVTYKDGNGAERQITGDYLVGCDGAKSIVRHQLGLAFEGDTEEELFFVADVKINSATLQPGNAYVNLTDGGFVIFFPMQGEHHYRVIGIVPDEFKSKEELAFDDFKTIIKIQAQFELGFEETFWFSTYRVHSRKANSFGRGRCYIAGDAAHIHTPAGGQGMNTGIQDAYNLAWKLAYVIKGKADPSLLETYSIERVANAEKLLKTTDRAFDLLTTEGIFGRFFRTYMIPFVAAIATKTSFTMRSVFPMISMLSIKYPHSPLTTKSHIGKIHAGDRMPYFLHKGVSIYEQLKNPGFKLLRFGNAAIPDDLFSDSVQLHIVGVPAFFEGETDFYIVLRPDNYISYIGRDLAGIRVV
jgi:2-polyprenyl-6-methoxyphenol hydroxylase-like FAD-dependent oxidoreductase